MAKMNGIERIEAERLRQVRLGYTSEHDEEHDGGELAGAGTAYADYAARQIAWGVTHGHPLNNLFRWSHEQWNPSDDPIRNLEKAGALIAAEIDRLLAERGEDDD